MADRRHLRLTRPMVGTRDAVWAVYGAMNVPVAWDERVGGCCACDRGRRGPVPSDPLRTAPAWMEPSRNGFANACLVVPRSLSHARQPSVQSISPVLHVR